MDHLERAKELLEMREQVFTSNGEWMMKAVCHAVVSIAEDVRGIRENFRDRDTCRFSQNEYGTWECSACGAAVDWDSLDPDDPPGCFFCPSCGAEVSE